MLLQQQDTSLNNNVEDWFSLFPHYCRGLECLILPLAPNWGWDMCLVRSSSSRSQLHPLYSLRIGRNYSLLFLCLLLVHDHQSVLLFCCTTSSVIITNSRGCQRAIIAVASSSSTSFKCPTGLLPVFQQ